MSFKLEDKPDGPSTDGIHMDADPRTTTDEVETIITIANAGSNAISNEIEKNDHKTTSVGDSIIEATQADASIIEATPADASIIEATQADVSAIEATPVDASIIEATPADASIIEATQADVSAIEATPADASIIEATQVDASIIEAASADDIIEATHVDDTGSIRHVCDSHDNIHAMEQGSEEGKLKESLRSNVSLAKRKVRGEDGAEANESVDHADDDLQSSDGKYHVRVDNFQRPLHLKALIEWLQALCLCIIGPDDIWINSIKTHCYVDFNTYTEAKLCIDKVSGQKFPLTSTYLLQADFTAVSAAEAPHSAEAALKPGAWKQATPVGSKRKIDEVKYDDIEASSKQEVEGTDSKSGEAANKRPAVQRLAARSNVQKVVGGADIFRRATAGILFGSKVASSDGLQNKDSLATRTRAADATMTIAKLPNEPKESLQQRWVVSSPVAVDELFKKTSAYPPIYWLPASDEVVQQRLKSKLMKARNVLT